MASAGAEPPFPSLSEPGSPEPQARPSDAASQPAPAAHARASRRELAAIGAMAIVVVIVDQVTKAWAQHRLADGKTIKIVGSLRLFLSYNSGMAFSRGRGFGPVIGVLALVMVVILLATLRREGSRLARIALGLVIGGAAGNIADRIFRAGGFLRGEVVDFIDPQFWPVFNVADSAVSVGGALLLLGALVSSRHRPSSPPTSSSAPPPSSPSPSSPSSPSPSSP